MQAEIHTNEDQLVTEFVERMNGAGDGPAAREAYREGFTRLRSQLEMYPVSGRPRFGRLRVGGKDREESRGRLSAVGHRRRDAPLPALRLAVHSPAATELREISAGDAPANDQESLADPGQCRGRAYPRGPPFPGRASGRRGHSNRWNVRIHVARHVLRTSSSSRRDWQTATARFCVRLTCGPTRCVSEVGDSPEACGCRTHLQ